MPSWSNKAWKGECVGCGHPFKEGEDKYANLWDSPKKEYCKSCYWKAPREFKKENGETPVRYKKVQHKSYMAGGAGQRFKDDDPV